MNIEIQWLIGHCQRLDTFIESQPSLWEQPIIQQFIKDEQHRKLLVLAICQPTPQNISQLNQAFYLFYGEMKLTSYMMKILHWRAVRFDQQLKQNRARYPLIMDKPLTSDKSITFADSLIHVSTLNLEEKNLADLFSEKTLSFAFRHLTAHQEFVLNKKYKEGWTDTDIAKALSISQQAVFKTRQKALDKIRTYTQRWGCD
ncbi:DNA-directed RNA polymerase specialized sigma24 family protein [Salibacterium salarium]|uniref:hypothetical protein n=1 Tax=Salibacterium salarium TaxID=284579 RepID=UPI00278A61C3|nr:hypothetical protein [Salibacterium salarium]MDQ0297758.1 DNA-directed RNA polymerase specialized sigma24 family protein [Salibacterium salarium]